MRPGRPSARRAAAGGRTAGKKPRFEPWSSKELQVIARHANGVLEGRYATLSDATRACLEAMARVEPACRGACRASRCYATVYGRICETTAGQRGGGKHTRWAREELAIVDRYVSALVEGRSDLASDVAPECLRELRRLWRRRAPSRRAAVPRDEACVFYRLNARARAAGWRSKREHWSEAEQAVLDRHVDLLVRGVHRSSHAAARVCRQELEQVRAKLRGRRHGIIRSLNAIRDRVVRQAEKQGWSLSAIRDRAVRQAEEQGWSLSATRWLPQEQRIVERHARRLLDVGGPRLDDVTRQCVAELGRLHDRLRVEKPDAYVWVIPRTLSTIKRYLDRRALELGRPIADAWQADEVRVIDRHARALIARRYVDAPTAARACQRELAELRRSWWKKDPERYRSTLPREFIGVYGRLCRQAHSLGERWPKTRWTPKELVLLNRAVDWYERHRGTRRLRPVEAAITGLQTELEQSGSHRALEGCRGRFWKEWHRRHGT